MEDIEIEYLDEYKDLVLPGIKTSSEGRASNQALMRLPQRRRISSDSSGSSSIDPDIFQKLFDGKFLDDELLAESGTNAKGRFRRRLSSSSSDSNDALDALYNRQSSQFRNNRRDRLESYDSIDDLGDALMGQTHKSQSKAVDFVAAKKSLSDGLHRSTGSTIGKSKSADYKLQANKPHLSEHLKPRSKPGNRPNGSSSSSTSSNTHLLPNKKKAITIIKAKKPTLKPPRHEPKEDPLHLQDFSDDSDSDSSYEYESDFYGYGDSDDDGEGSKQVIDISTDSSTATSLADTVTPVVSEDESLQQQKQQHMPCGDNERLQLYLNNLSSAESPPSKHKYTANAKKSRSHEKQSTTTAQTDNDQVNDSVDQAVAKAEQQFDGPSSSTGRRKSCNESEKTSRADYVDVNLTYETLERLSLSLAEQIINIDVERSKEFEKRSASKPRSTSIPKLVIPTIGLSSSKSHVRKLTYSSENLDKIAPKKTELRRAKSDSAFPKRGRRKQAKTRAATTEEQNNCVPLSLPTISNAETREQETKNESEIRKEAPTKPEKIKRKRGRPRKKRNISKTEANDAVSENLTEQPSVVPSENENKTVKVDEDINLNLTTDESAYKTPEKSKRAQPQEELRPLSAALRKLADADSLEAPTDEAEANKTITYLDPEDTALFKLQDSLNDSIKSACGAFREIKAKDNIHRKLAVGKRLTDTELEIYKSPRLISAGKCLEENSVSQSQAQGSAGQCEGEDGVNQERAFKNASEIVNMDAKDSEMADTEDREINMRDTADQERTELPALDEMSSQGTLDIEVSRDRMKDIETSDGNVDEQITGEEPAKIDEPSEQTLPDKSLDTNIDNLSERDKETEKSEESKETLIAKIDMPEEVTTKVDMQQTDEEMDNGSSEKLLMINPITNIQAEKNHSKANKSDNPESTMKTRRSALAKASPCPGNMSPVISTGRESRSSKRLLRGDNNSVVNTGTPHRNSPRLLEKSPASSDASVTSKGHRKDKKDKSVGDLLATKTPEKSNVEINIERKTRKPKHEVPKQEESLNDRPLRSSKPSTSETTENEKSEAIDKTHKKPKESTARVPQLNDIDNTPKERKSRRLKQRSKIEKSPSKQKEKDVSHLESLHNPTALGPESIEEVNNEDSSTTAGLQSVSSASESEVNNTKGTDTEISSTVDTVFNSSAGAQLATAVEAESVSVLELPTTMDLNDKFKSTCSEDQPIFPENPLVVGNKDEAIPEGQKDTEEAVAFDVVNTLEETAKGKLRGGLTREVRDLIQEAKEWEGESIESHGRSTRSRVATPVPLKGRRVRSREPKSAERPAKDQNKTTADTEPASSESTVKELPKKGQKEAIKKTKNDPPEIVSEPATPLKADASAQSEFDKTSSDIQESNADEHIEKPAPRFAKQKRRAAKNINNQTNIVETEPAPANSVTPKMTNNSSTPFPSTPSTCSSVSSRRKLRILLRKVMPRSKINFSQKLENVQEGDEILNSSSDQQPEDIALEQVSVDNPLDNRGDSAVNADSLDQAVDNVADPYTVHAQTDMTGDAAEHLTQSGPGQNLTDLPSGQGEVNPDGDSIEPEIGPTQTAAIQKIDKAADDTSTGSEVPLSDQQTISTENADKELCPEQESADHDVDCEQTQSETANEKPQKEEKAADEDKPQNEMETAKEQQQTENKAAEKNEQQNNMEHSHKSPKPEKDASDDGQHHSEEQPNGDNDNDNSCPTETTGVTENVDDAGDDEERCTDSVSSNRKLKNREMDASQPDAAAKRKKMLQAKESHAGKGASNITAMAPPAPPKRELSTGKAVLRRLGKPLQTDVQPTQKRRKLASSTVEHQAKASDMEPSSLHKAIEELRDEARKPMLLATDAKKLLAKEAMQGVVLGQTATKLSRKKEVNKTPPVKSSLSTLLSGDDSMTIDNSVIITKTAITSTTEPFKKVETPSTPVSGINISVSLVPDANKLVSSPPKKTLTQAETVRKMMLMNTPSKMVDATKEPASVSEKTLAPFDSGKKSKTRKSEAGVSTTDKRASLPAKISLPRKAGKTAAPIEAIKKPMSMVETSEKLETKQAAQPAAAVLNTITTRKSFPQAQAKKLEAVLAAPAASPSLEDKEMGVSAATEKLSDAKPVNKMELRKVANKSFGKSKSKESLVTAVEQPPIPLATNPTSDSRDSSNERTKRSSRMTKLSLTNSKTSTPVTRACSQIRSTTATPTITPTQQRNASNEQQQLTLPQLVGQLPPKPQRQSRKSLKLAVAEPQAPQPQPQPQPEIPKLALAPPSRKRKLAAKPVTEVANAKRPKELPVIPDTSIAFPVRITAASTVTDTGSEKAVPVPETITKAPAPPITSEKPVQKPKELQLAPQPLPQKTRKLRVRLNRNVIKNWVLGLQEIEPPPEPNQAQPVEPPTAIAPISETATIPPAKEAEPVITRAQPVAQTQLPKAPVVRSMPLPVPLPVLEVKAEQVEVEEQQQILPPEGTVHMEVDVPVPTLSQVAANISCSVNTCAAAPTLISMAPTTHADINVPTTTNCSRSTAISSTTASSTTISSNATSSTIPSANSLSDQHTFGTTKMFSFLYPSRYQRSYGHVGLDFCCPNLDGPMQAIDPTRLHSKVEVPVLELPQYMVISTKIISKQDKNIPQKVRAKLEQLAAKDALPGAIQTTATLTTASIATSTAPAATHVPTAPPSTSNIDPLPKQQQPRNSNLTKKVNLPNAAAATPGTSVASSQSVASLVPGMLQLPPICPTDKLRVELQTRVQLFDIVLQSLARRATSMTVSERKQVIESIVRTSTLLPIDVDVGTKLLENYVYYINAITNTISPPMPQIRAVVKAAASTPTSTPASTSNSVLAKALNTSHASPAAGVNSPPVAAGSVRQAESAPSYKPPATSRPIYDKDKNIIGYQYKTPKLTLGSTPVRAPAASSTPRGSTARGSLTAASGIGTPAATVTQQQRTRVLMMPAGANSKVVGASSADTPVEAASVAKRVGSGTINPFNPSPAQKTYARSTKSSTHVAPANLSRDIATPVGVVNGVPVLGTKGASSPASAAPASASKEAGSNRNLFIVNQVLSQTEECILPDTIRATDAAAEIKGEVEDAEILT